MPKHAPIRAARPIKAKARPLAINRAPSPRWVDHYREQVKSSALLNRLQTFALADPDNATSPRMTRTQAMVALALLRKVLPDMQSLEISGNSDAPISIQLVRFSDGITLDMPKSLPALEEMPHLIDDAPAEPYSLSDARIPASNPRKRGKSKA